MSRIFEARYPGECAWCGQEFEAGDDVQYIDGALVGPCCVDYNDEEDW